MDGTEALIRVGDAAVQVGAGTAQVRQRERKEEEAEAADEPCHKGCARRGHVGELPGQGKDAGADAGRHHHADEAEEADAVGVVHCR